MSAAGQARERNLRAKGYSSIHRDPAHASDASYDAEMLVLSRYGVEHAVRATGETTCDYRQTEKVRHGRTWREVTQCLEVKWTDHVNGRLLEQPGKHICLVYILVVGEAPAMRIVGWTYGFLLVKHWGADLPIPAYAMPQALLRPNVDLMMATTFGLAVQTT